MRVAVMDGDLVVNIVLCEQHCIAEAFPSTEVIALGDGDFCGPGWTRVDGIFVAPAEPDAPAKPVG